MKKLLFNLVLLNIFFIQMASDNFICFLYGTGSTGKTSLCNKITENNKWKVISEDDVIISAYLKLISKKFPNEYSNLEHCIEHNNIYNALRRSYLFFKEDATDDQKKLAFIAIQAIRNNITEEFSKEFKNIIDRKLLRKIHKAYNSGLNVAIDTWYLSEKNIRSISFIYNVKHVLVYCPFETMIKRIIDRNRKAYDGQASEHRLIRGTLSSFMKLFDLGKTPKKSIDIINKKEIINGFKLIEKSLALNLCNTVVSIDTQTDFSLAQLLEYKNKILKLFDKQESLFLKTKNKYDLVINTGKLNTQEALEQIINIKN